VEHDLVQPPLVLLFFFFFFGSTTADLTWQANGTPKSSSLLDGGTTSFTTSTEWGYTLQVLQWNNPFYHLNNSCEPSCQTDTNVINMYIIFFYHYLNWFCKVYMYLPLPKLDFFQTYIPLYTSCVYIRKKLLSSLT
jgi:hypothetical protein